MAGSKFWLCNQPASPKRITAVDLFLFYFFPSHPPKLLAWLYSEWLGLGFAAAAILFLFESFYPFLLRIAVLEPTLSSASPIPGISYLQQKTHVRDWHPWVCDT